MSSKSQRKKVESGQVHITARFNNTLVTVTDSNGAKLTASSAGACGFKGARKSTPFAAQQATIAAVSKAVSDYGLKFVEVYVEGPGSGRELAVRALGDVKDVEVTLIQDVTGFPHNGVRGSGERRV